jgi:L-alanine-DL-glutamate epimerase-like enolase superfamily enzyme
MKIGRVECLPVHSGWRKNFVLVRIETDAGVVGWGEAAAAFVARLQPCQLPGRAARQLPDQSTTLWVDSSSTGDSRLRGARPQTDIDPFSS